MSDYKVFCPHCDAPEVVQDITGYGVDNMGHVVIHRECRLCGCFWGEFKEEQ